MRPMGSLQILSSIQELPENGFFSAITSKKNSFFPKKKLSRLHDMKNNNKTNYILPPSMCAERVQDRNNNDVQKSLKKELVIPKIIVEEIRFEDDLVLDPIELRYEQSQGFLHPSYAIYSAVSANDPYALKNIILSGRVNANRLNASGVTALHEAAYEGKSRCVEVLVQCGASVDIKDREGWAPLHAAVCGGHKTCVAFLLKSGANLRSKNDDGLSPLGVAVQQGNKDMAEFLTTLRANQSAHQNSINSSQLR